MKKATKQRLIKKMQRLLWVYPCYIFFINSPDEMKKVEPKIACEFVPITMDNYHRVAEFREDERISEYRDKIEKGEIGYFAQHGGKIIGSIWATVNKTKAPCIAKTYFELMPDECLLHDNFISENYRGMRVGAFLESNMPVYLFREYKLKRIITDINVRNYASLQMVKKAGLRRDHKMLFVSAFGKSIVKLMIGKCS
jgi:RimJ/RimL family protein N-acetyltransferase